MTPTCVAGGLSRATRFSTSTCTNSCGMMRIGPCTITRGPASQSSSRAGTWKKPASVNVYVLPVTLYGDGHGSRIALCCCLIFGQHSSLVIFKIHLKCQSSRAGHFLSRVPRSASGDFTARKDSCLGRYSPSRATPARSDEGAINESIQPRPDPLHREQ